MELRVVKVAAREEGDGALVLVDGWLVAVLVRLAGHHGELSGHWFLESGYGRFSEIEQVTFATLPLAEDWFVSHLSDQFVTDQWRPSPP